MDSQQNMMLTKKEAGTLFSKQISDYFKDLLILGQVYRIFWLLSLMLSIKNIVPQFVGSFTVERCFFTLA